ncbi:TraX family protein [Methyloversatilis universalis]|uniref:TraX family protein n=1 Tax=Methyloversatilis universalis TaxID=378211 RepID=UPI0003F86769|nr:TraX family protein [Methyloversatilis universalis]
MARPLITRLAELPVKAVEAARATVLPIHPLQIDVLKLIACICMLIDHINTCLFDRASVWAWLIGRLAFPLFGLTFVLTLKPHKAMATARRLLIWAICTQPVYALAFANTGFSPWWAGNILFSFATVAYLVALAQAPSAANVAKGLAVVGVASIIQAPSSFGFTGLMLLTALYQAAHASQHVKAVCWVVGAVAFFLVNHMNASASVLLVSMLIACFGACVRVRQLPSLRFLKGRWALWFYAAHVFSIAVWVCDMVRNVRLT